MKNFIFILSGLVFMLVSCAGNDFTSFNSELEENPSVSKSKCVPEISSPIVYTTVENLQNQLYIKHCHEDRSLTVCWWNSGFYSLDNYPNNCNPRR